MARKKIFIIHGKGVRKGLGVEGGGDLDTVGSNALYAAWIKNTLKMENNKEPVYGVDYEYDFVNYQAGLSHLKVHKGCDIYIPDFPIDALAPRLKMLKIIDTEDEKIRAEFTRLYEEFKYNIYSMADNIDKHLKFIFNDMINRTKTIFATKSKVEIGILYYLYFIFNEIVKSASEKEKNTGIKELILAFKSFVIGENFIFIKRFFSDYLETRRGKLNANLIAEIKEKYKEKGDEAIKLIEKLRKTYFSVSFKILKADQLFVILVELATILLALIEFLEKGKDFLEKEDLEKLKEIKEELRKNIIFELERFINYIETHGGKKVEKYSKIITTKLENIKKVFEKIEKVNLEPEEKLLSVMLIEDENLRVVPDIDVTFKIIRGRVHFKLKGKKYSEKSIDIKTNKNGCATVEIEYPKDEKYYITATYDDLNFIEFTNITEEGELQAILSDLESESVSEEKSTDEVISTDEPDSAIESGTPPTRALKVSLELIKRDLKLLKENDVRIIRFDDHHPWTREIYDTLQDMVKEGYITETVNLSSLERTAGEQPIEEQKCGTDLIYENFIKDKPYDNTGYKMLQYLAHVQDLHIKQDKLAVALSKLIGSGYSKISMAEALSEVKDKKELKNIMKLKGWDEIVQKYEEGLAEVLPRVEKNLVRARFLRKPPDGDYSKKLGILSILKILAIFKPKELRQEFYKKLYAMIPSNRVDVYMALSPFTDRKQGEAKINVASAINYLSPKYKMDYFFYCYGSMLMTTRRVNAKKEDINLSTFVAHVGTKADGGHPSAATGKPASNPKFPKEKFAKVNDSNFYEYALYIAEKVIEHTGLELYSIDEVKIKHYEPEIEEVLPEIEENMVYIKLRESSGQIITILAVKNRTKKNPQLEPDLNLSMAINYLIYRKKYKPDYFIFCQGTSRMIIRNINDPYNRINIDKVVKNIGGKDDSGTLKAGVAFPQNNPSFPIDKFKFLNTFSFPGYVVYLGKKIAESMNFEYLGIEEVKPKLATPDMKQKYIEIHNTAFRINGKKEKENLSIIVAYTPVVEEFGTRFAFPVPCALAYLKETFTPDILLYTDGMNIVLRNYKRSFEIKTLLNSLTNKPDIIDNEFVLFNMKLSKLPEELGIRWFDGFSFSFLGLYIKEVIKKAGYEIQNYGEVFVPVIPSTNEEILDKTTGTLRLVEFQKQKQKSNILFTLLPYYDETSIRITINEVLTYFKGKVKNIGYIALHKGKTLIVRNVNDKNNLLDLKKLLTIGAPEDTGVEELAIIHPLDNPEFPERLKKINKVTFPDYVEYIVEQLKSIYEIVPGREQIIK